MKYQNKIIFFFILVLISINIFCAYYNNFYNAKKYYNSAYQEIKKSNSTELSNKTLQNLEISVEKSLKLIDLYPKSKYIDDAHLLLGKCYYYQKKYIRARKYLNQLIKYQPKSELLPQAQLWLIKIDVADLKYNNAELKINDLLEKKIPAKIEGELLFIRANLYSKNNNYQEAIDYYNKCIKINNELRSEALFAIASIYDSLNNYKQSVKYFQKVFRSNPNEQYDFKSRFRYGIVLKKQNKIDLALKTFDELLLKDLDEKQITKIHLQIADCLMLQRNIRAAILEFEDIINNYPRTEESAISYFKLAKFFERRMEYKIALQNYIQVENEFSKSMYIDSAKNRKEALFKLLALQKVISVSLQDSSETKEISSKIIFSDFDDSYFSDDTSKVSLIKHNNNKSEDEKEGINNNQQNQLENNSKLPADQNQKNSPDLKKRKSNRPQEVVNPEINKLDLKNLDKNLFLLSEVFMLYFNKPDSALVKYKFIIDNFSESEYAVKAYFNSAYIYDKIKNDTIKSDSVYNLIIAKYPNSKIANSARKELGKEVKESDDLVIMNLHKQAEEYMFTKNDPEKACEIYTNIIKTYPTSDLLPKVYYSLGWCYENILDSLQAAYVIYDSLLIKYPESKYSKQINKKVQIVKEFQKKEESEAKKKESILKADTTQQKLPDELPIPPTKITDKDTTHNKLKDETLLLEEKDTIEKLGKKEVNDKEIEKNKKKKLPEK